MSGSRADIQRLKANIRSNKKVAMLLFLYHILLENIKEAIKKHVMNDYCYQNAPCLYIQSLIINFPEILRQLFVYQVDLLSLVIGVDEELFLIIADD